MHPSSATKRVVALATILCLSLTPAAPAWANPETHDLAITGGRILGLPLLPEGTPPCTQKADTLQSTFTPLSPGNWNGTMRLTGGWSTEFQLGLPPSGQWYQADFTVLNLPPPAAHFLYIQRNPPSPPPWWYDLEPLGTNEYLVLQVRIYRVGQFDCVKDDLACIITARFALTGFLTSVWPLPGYAPGTITLNGTSVSPHLAVTSCSAPFVSWGGQLGTVTGWTLV